MYFRVLSLQAVLHKVINRCRKSRFSAPQNTNKMTSKNWLALPLVLLSFTLYARDAHAANITAASCSAADVQAAINSASSGDTVQTPSSACSVTWTAQVVIPSTKGITLDCRNNATITTGIGTQYTAALLISPNASASTRVTNCAWVFNTPASTGYSIQTQGCGGLASCGGTKTAPFRIDHNTFTLGSNATSIQSYGNAPALIDHNTFTAPSGSEEIHNSGMGASDASGWTDSVTPGSPLMYYVEDNTFNNTGTGVILSAMQNYNGARTVFRHNTLNFSQIDVHGTPGMIGGRWYEIYSNTFQANGLNQCCYGAIRGGSGVVWGNHQATAPPLNGPAGFSFFEEDTGSWPLAYQVGSGINGGANQHNTCAGGTLNSSPAYVWGNDAGISVGGGSGVQMGRDVFSSANQPASLLRQQISGDTCATTYNYAPFTYPYPLDANGLPNPNGTSAQQPASPTNLSATVQ
jgi:hypothetical protein